MTAKHHVTRFGQIRSGAYGDPHRFHDERSQILWVLAMAKADQDLDYLTPAQVSDILCDSEGIDISRQRVAAILDGETGIIAKKRVAGKRHFKIMKAGEDVVQASSLTSSFVDPEKALSEIRKVEDTLSSLAGDLKICDPYVDNKTLDFLAECGAASSMRLMTVNVLKQSRFRRDLAAFHREHGNRLDVRVAAQPNLHDRYIVHDDGLLVLGTSLNGFAKKQSMVITLGADLRAAAEVAFDRYWASAANF